MFSPDGKTLAVSENVSGIIHLWDLGSGEQRILKGHASSPGSLAFAPDGKLLATTDGRQVICWHVAKGEQLWRSAGAHGMSLAFTADGRTVIASPGSRERTWHAWNAATGKPAEGLKLPEGYNYAESVVAPDGRTLVFVQPRSVQGADGRVRLWDLRSGKLLRTLPAGGQIGPFAPDGKSFLTNDGTLQRWELATGRPLLPDTDELGHRAEVSRAVYSPDGRRLASAAGDGTIRLWEVATAKPLHTLRGREATGLAFTPDGKFLVSGGNEGELFVWDTETGKEVRRIPLHDPKAEEKKQNVWKLHLTPDGLTIIVLGYSPDGGIIPEGILTRWDLKTGRRKTRTGEEYSDGFYSAFSPDGQLLASRSVLLDTVTGERRVKLEPATNYLGHYAFSPDGRQVAGLLTRTERTPLQISTKMEGIQIWDAASGRAVSRIPTDWVGQIAFSPDARYLAAADKNGLRLWELATGAVVVRHKAHERMQGSYGNSFASCVSFAPDGRTLATGHVDATVLIWEMAPSVRPASADDLPHLWDELAGADAAKAYAAFWRLKDTPKQTLLFLRKRLQPASPIPAEQTRPLLADLDSSDFRRREAASVRLRELDSQAETALREALKANPSLEQRRRVEALLQVLEGPLSGKTLRGLRAVAVLERIATPEARGLLKELTGGDPTARLTREAKASLECLAKRH